MSVFLGLMLNDDAGCYFISCLLMDLSESTKSCVFDQIGAAYDLGSSFIHSRGLHM